MFPDEHELYNIEGLFRNDNLSIKDIVETKKSRQSSIFSGGIFKKLTKLP